MTPDDPGPGPVGGLETDRGGTIPAGRWPSLAAPAMAPVWEVVRRRLERSGVDNRGQVELPPIDAEARLTLAALVERAPTKRLDLHRVEEGLRRHNVGTDLVAALDELGFPVSLEPGRRRAERAVGQQARAAAREAACEWPEPWAEAWVDAVVKAGTLRRLGVDEALGVVASARRVLDALDGRGATFAGPMSRVELAAQVLGDAHALDTGSRVEAAVSRALVLRSGPPDARSVWEAAGVDLDLTSAPALTWNLGPVVSNGPGSEDGAGLGALVEAATALGVPVHLSRMLLAERPASPRPGAEVLVVENPRIVEAAAQARSALSVISAGGSPSGAVQLLVRQLLDGGATVRYHGDFDAAGLALCARMAAMGVVPWRMTTQDYRAAVAVADADGVRLPVDEAPPPATPWDPELRDVFASERRIVHEERLLPALLHA